MEFKKFNIVCGNWDDFFLHPERPKLPDEVFHRHWPENGGGKATLPPYKQIEKAKEAVQIFNANDHRFTLVATNSLDVLKTFNTCMLAYQTGCINDYNEAKVDSIISKCHWLCPDDVSCYCVLGKSVTDMLRASSNRKCKAIDFAALEDKSNLDLSYELLSF